MNNIVIVRNIKNFYKKHPDSKPSLVHWLEVTKKAEWRTSLDVVKDFPTADPIKDNRVVFNIAGNKYRLIVKISYIRQWVFIKFLNTHAEYDKIDANTVDAFKKTK